jgi:GDP-L-fucose synthase
MPTNLYGPNDNFDLASSHVLAAFIRKFVEAVDAGSSELTLWGSGSPMREFLHTDDLADAVVFCSENYDETLHLNIGTGIEISIKRLAELVATLAGYSGDVHWDTTKPDGTPRKVMDISRVQKLGWSAQIGLEKGIAETIEWYRRERLGK